MLVCIAEALTAETCAVFDCAAVLGRLVHQDRRVECQIDVLDVREMSSDLECCALSCGGKNDGCAGNLRHREDGEGTDGLALCRKGVRKSDELCKLSGEGMASSLSWKEFCDDLSIGEDSNHSSTAVREDVFFAVWRTDWRTDKESTVNVVCRMASRGLLSRDGQ